MPRRRRKGNLARVVKNILHKSKETKFAGFSADATDVQDVGRTPITVHLSAIAQGDGENERDGTLVRATGLYFKGFVAGADTTNVVRLIVARYKHDWLSAPFGSIAPTTLLDLDTFDVLWDKMLVTGSSGPAVRPFEIKINLRKKNKLGMPITFDGTASNNVSVNPLYLYAVSDSGAISDPTISYEGRLYYKDY